MRLNAYEHYLLKLTNVLVHYLQSLGASQQDAEDIAQEAVVKILEIDSVLTAEAIRPWLFRVGINGYFTLYKQTKRRREIVRQYLPVTASGINWQETDDDLYETLQELPVSTSTLLIMKYAENLSLKEISFLLNRPEDSIKTALYRGRKQLKKRMEEKNHDY